MLDFGIPNYRYVATTSMRIMGSSYSPSRSRIL